MAFSEKHDIQLLTHADPKGMDLDYGSFTEIILVL